MSHMVMNGKLNLAKNKHLDMGILDAVEVGDILEHII